MNAAAGHVRMELHVTMVSMDIHVRVPRVILGTPVMKVIYLYFMSELNYCRQNLLTHIYKAKKSIDKHSTFF